MFHETNEDVQAEAADIAAALRNLKPNQQHRKNKLFALLYPTICEMLRQNVTQKALLEALEEKGLKLHPSRFKELMKAEEMAKSNGITADGEGAQ